MLYTCAQNRAKNLHFSNFFTAFFWIFISLSRIPDLLLVLFQITKCMSEMLFLLSLRKVLVKFKLKHLSHDLMFPFSSLIISDLALFFMFMKH